jgi:hypothetical protein
MKYFVRSVQTHCTNAHHREQLTDSRLPAGSACGSRQGFSTTIGRENGAGRAYWCGQGEHAEKEEGDIRGKAHCSISERVTSRFDESHCGYARAFIRRIGALRGSVERVFTCQQAHGQLTPLHQMLPSSSILPPLRKINDAAPGRPSSARKMCLRSHMMSA